MKLWHDDVRSPPEGWVWAQNNEDAKLTLKTRAVTEIPMDHDLGASPSDGLFARGSSQEGSGYDLAVWMVENTLVPPVITIHSWSTVGAQRMADVFNDAGYDVTIRPYRVEPRKSIGGEPERYPFDHHGGGARHDWPTKLNHRRS